MTPQLGASLLTTLEVSFTIIIFLEYRPKVVGDEEERRLVRLAPGHGEVQRGDVHAVDNFIKLFCCHNSWKILFNGC